jgi:hypothetical protein
LNNLKNDFSVWGNRKGITGKDIPIHARYAIDTKPKYYYSIKEEKAYTTLEFLEDYPEATVTDWREIIY